MAIGHRRKGNCCRFYGLKPSGVIREERDARIGLVRLKSEGQAVRYGVWLC